MRNWVVQQLLLTPDEAGNYEGLWSLVKANKPHEITYTAYHERVGIIKALIIYIRMHIKYPRVKCRIVDARKYYPGLYR